MPHLVQDPFGIRLLDRTRDESYAQDVDDNIDNHKAGRSIGRAVSKARGSRVAVGKQSASIAKGRIIARKPRHRIRWTTPSQQGHHDPDAVTLPAVAAA